MMKASDKLARRKRLAELITKDGRLYPDLVEAIESLDTDGSKKYKIAPTHICEIVNYENPKYTRGLSDKYVEPFSKVLGVNVGYLRGDDQYKAASYDEYLIAYEDQPYFREDWTKYDRILSLAGAKVVNTLYDEYNTLLGYIISKDGRTSVFSEEDLSRYITRFYEDVCEYAGRRFDSVMDLGSVPETDSEFSINVEHAALTKDEIEEGR